MKLNFVLNWENASLSEKSLCDTTCMYLMYMFLYLLQHFLLASDIYFHYWFSESLMKWMPKFPLLLSQFLLRRWTQWKKPPCEIYLINLMELRTVGRRNFIPYILYPNLWRRFFVVYQIIFMLLYSHLEHDRHNHSNFIFPFERKKSNALYCISGKTCFFFQIIKKF